MNKYMIALLIVLSAVYLSGCGTENNESSLNNQSSDVEYGESDYANIVPSNNKLGFKILSEIQRDSSENIFFSPTSLMMALSMVYNGASGDTKDEIGKVLHAEGIDINDLNRANASLMSTLNKDTEHVDLNIANSIWLNETYHFQDDFSQQTEDYFNAKIEALNFGSPETPKQMNDWVKQATSDKIDHIVDSPLDQDLVSILMNAIYFKGNWKYEFDQSLTEDDDFFISETKTETVPFMTLNKEELAYMENEQFQAVALPYGNEDMSMKVFLPHKSVSEHDFEEMFTHDHWTIWNDDFRKKEGTVILPKFTVSYEVELNEALKSLGMVSAFDRDHADFSNMIEEENPLWISRIKQKAYTDIHEEGTEAAAATSVEMKTTSAPVDGPFYMNVNRPFFIAITDDETDTILFMGWIINPSAESE